MSERSHFPPAKIKHFTRSCQILIRRKLAEEYHFPKQTGQVFLSPPPGVVSRSPLTTLISSSVISSCLNASSEESWGCVPLRSFVIKKEKDKALCGGRSRLPFETGEDEVSPVQPGSQEQPERPASARTYTLTQVRPQSPCQISPKQYLRFFWPAVCVPGSTEGGGEEKRKRKKTHTHTQNRAQRDVSKAAAHTRQPRRREERAARRQHQHRFCSHRSAGNYDNNVFPRQLLSDLVSEHLPFLKSPPDNI